MDKEKNSEKKPFSVPKITDKEELAEIKKIVPRLDDDEKVHLVAKRIGELSVSGTIFVTNKRIIMVDSGIFEDLSYEQLSDARLEEAHFSYTLVIKTRKLDETMLALKRKMMQIHGQVEWKENRGYIRGIPRNKGELLFKIVQYRIQETKT
ncbi:MAG: PH domain-containing protein [Nitrosopumilaceae archaeon]